jgi:membrane-associated protein
VPDLVDFVLHIDRHLLDLVTAYGAWIYAILFLIVFAETGLIVTPFLPGDSLLFATGAIAATGALHIGPASLLLLIAAIVGDAVNYTVGRAAGARLIHLSRVDPRWGRWINPAYVDRAHDFFLKHGGKAVVLGRFMPIVRTFVPFVAGAAEMSYPAFAFYNVTGALAWVGVCVGAGYMFGNVPIVKDNFSIVAIGIVAVSLLPMFIEYLRYRRDGISKARPFSSPPSSPTVPPAPDADRR